MSEPEHQGITEATAAKLLSISPRMLRHLVSEGWIPRQSRGRYGLVPTVQGYIKYRDDLERRGESREAADSDLRRARTAEIQQRIAQRDADLIDIDEHRAVAEEAFGIIALELNRLPPAVPRQLRKRVRVELDDILKRARQRFDRATEQLAATGRAPIPPAEETS